RVVEARAVDRLAERAVEPDHRQPQPVLAQEVVRAAHAPRRRHQDRDARVHERRHRGAHARAHDEVDGPQGPVAVGDDGEPVHPSSSPSRYSPYPLLTSGSASARSSASEMKPSRQAISSGDPIRSPWRSSIPRTNSAACISELNVPVSSHAVPRSSTPTRRLPRRRYSRLTSVISISPRGDGRTLRAISTTSLS